MNDSGAGGLHYPQSGRSDTAAAVVDRYQASTWLISEVKDKEPDRKVTILSIWCGKKAQRQLLGKGYYRVGPD
jgi:hypothetical protein